MYLEPLYCGFLNNVEKQSSQTSYALVYSLIPVDWYFGECLEISIHANSAIGMFTYKIEDFMI